MKIVVLDGYTLNPGDLTWDEMKRLGDLHVYERTNVNKVYDRSKDATIILTNKTPISSEVINKLPSLKYIGVLATGYNIVDVDAAKQKGIAVTNVPGYGPNSVAQLAFALLLELCHHVQRHSDEVKQGKWARSPDWCYWDYPLLELFDKTIGIIGVGTIGLRVADIATAFGMKILGVSRTKTDQSHRKNFKWVSLDELFGQSDVISIHCPLTHETNGLINKNTLSKMKPSAFLLNTSRGPIVDDMDLADALNGGVIAGAGIDVLSVEPPPADNPLLTAKNCLITPHLAWATKEARTRLMDGVVDNISAFLSGKPMNVVNK
jgi:glycerate dehydrogenase